MSSFIYWTVQLLAVIGGVLSIYLWWTRRVRLAITIEEPTNLPIPDPGYVVASPISARVVNRSHERSARLFRISLFGRNNDSNEPVLICSDEAMPRVLEPRARYRIHFNPVASSTSAYDAVFIEAMTEDGQVERSVDHRLFRK